MKSTNEKICKEKSKIFIMLCCLLFQKMFSFTMPFFSKEKNFSNADSDSRQNTCILSRKRTLFIHAFILLSDLYCYTSANSKWFKRSEVFSTNSHD